MKKYLAFFVAACLLSTNAMAESIVVIDSYGNVVRQMYTSPSTYVEQPTVVTTQPMQTVTVVRESPVIQNSYYYDSYATNAALAAGVTTAVVGGLLFHGFHGGHHHHHHGGGHHGGGHHGGGHHHR